MGEQPTTSRTIESQALHRLLEIARLLAAPGDLTELLGRIVAIGRDALQADRGTVFLFDAASRELCVKVATGLNELRFSIDKGIAGECARTRCVINVPDCYADARFHAEVDRQTAYRTRNLLAVPLIGLDHELVGVMQMLNSARGTFDEQDAMLAEMFASHAAVALQRARLIDERMVKLKLERDLQLARQIQLGVLPPTLPELPGYNMAAFSRPAEQTGGDIYDAIPLDQHYATSRTDCPGDRVMLLLADATGHGIGPALSVTQVRSMIRLAARLGASIDAVAAHVNEQLCIDLASNRFVTAFMGILDAARNELIYHAAGQGPLLHYHAQRDVCTFLNASTVPLGILPDAPFDPPEPMKLASGDKVVLLTDGFYEYSNSAGDQFGREKIAQLVRDSRDATAQQTLDTLLDAVTKFAHGAPQLDDLTAIIIHRQ